MSNLFGVMSVSAEALMAQQAGLQVTSDNIANVNTNGYTRKRVVLTEAMTFDGTKYVGSGVAVSNVESLRDRVLEMRICDETQQQGKLSGFLSPMQQMETLFSDADNGLNSEVDDLFGTFSKLSSDPSNIQLRQNVLLAAQNVASAFHEKAQALKSLQSSIDSSLDECVTDVNTLTQQIAALNVEVTSRQKLGRDSSDFEDRRTELVKELSQQIGVSMVDSNDGLTLTTESGAPLVVGEKCFELKTMMDPSGLTQIYSGNTDITGYISVGKIGGLLSVRDEQIPSVLADLNAIASSLGNGLNQANSSGYSLYGSRGGPIFSDADGIDAASNLSVVMSDPKLIAASSDGSAGDNANLANFNAVRDAEVLNGQNIMDVYAGMVAEIGMQVATATSESAASDLAMQQLQNQRGAISGVSLDEESTNLIRYQRAYEASARMISVIDELLQTALSIGRES